MDIDQHISPTEKAGAMRLIELPYSKHSFGGNSLAIAYINLYLSLFNVSCEVYKINKDKLHPIKRWSQNDSTSGAIFYLLLDQQLHGLSQNDAKSGTEIVPL